MKTAKLAIAMLVIVAGIAATAPVASSGTCVWGASYCVCAWTTGCYDTYTGKECLIAVGLSNTSYQGVVCEDPQPPLAP